MTSPSRNRSSQPAALTASFDRAARSYELHARVQASMADWLAEWLPPQRVGRALEVGAGSGVFTRRILPWSGRLIASDIAPAMCEQGRLRTPEADWRVQPAEVPAGGPWDWIFCSSMLQWAPEPEGIFSAWRDSLDDGGRVLAGIFVEDTLREWSELTSPALPLRWRTVDQWRAHLSRAGFRLVRDACEQRVFHYSSALALLRSLHGTGTAPYRRSSPGRLRALLRSYEARFCSDQGVSATWAFYRFEARR